MELTAGRNSTLIIRCTLQYYTIFESKNLYPPAKVYDHRSDPRSCCHHAAMTSILCMHATYSHKCKQENSILVKDSKEQ